MISHTVLSVFASCCLDRQSREDSGFDFRISAYSLILNFVMQQGVSELRFKKKKKKKKKEKKIQTLVKSKYCVITGLCGSVGCAFDW